MSEPQWYYLQSAQRIGPLTQAQIVDVFRSGGVPLETMVCCDAFGYWVPASTIGGFRALVPNASAGQPENSTPPPAPSGAPPAVAASAVAAPAAPAPQLPPPPVPAVVPVIGNAVGSLTSPPADAPHPWRRWAARWVDETLALILWAALLAAITPLAAPTLLTRVVLLVAIFPAVFVVIEAALLFAFGATPGKALFGVVVREQDGGLLSFGRALHRSFRVFVQGIGMGLPVLSLCTVLSAYFSLNDGGVTAWDRAGRFRVTHRWISPAQRLTALLILTAALLIHFRTVAVALYGS